MVLIARAAWSRLVSFAVAKRCGSKVWSITLTDQPSASTQMLRVGLPSTFMRRLEKRLDAGLRAAEDQGVDVVGALVGVDGLQVGQHAHDVEFVGDAVAAVHVARKPRDVERLAAIVALHQRDRGRRGAALLQEAAEPERAGKPERNLGLHVGKFFLDKLV